MSASAGGPFDPLGWSKGNVDELKTKELKNGRLAMVAFAGFVGQHAANGEPAEILEAHQDYGRSRKLYKSFSVQG